MWNGSFREEVFVDGCKGACTIGKPLDFRVWLEYACDTNGCIRPPDVGSQLTVWEVDDDGSPTFQLDMLEMWGMLEPVM